MAIQEQLYASAAAEASAVVSAAPARVSKVIIFNDKVSAQYIQLFDSVTVPADTTVPDLCVIVPADSSYVIDFPRTIERRAAGGQDRPPLFETGVAISNSSTAATKTIGTTDCLFYVFGEAE
jgi:ribosomal protein S12 methylthiotransferase accessory factor YcaO